MHLGKRLEKMAQREAKEAQRGGGGDKRSPRARKPGRESFPKRSQDETKRTRAKVAVGVSDRTYEKAKAVVESKDRKLIDEMNRTGLLVRLLGGGTGLALF